MTAAIKDIKTKHVKGLIKRISAQKKKDPSSFFGKLKDGLDGLAFQKKLRDEWK
jgi:hypothetical protein